MSSGCGCGRAHGAGCETEFQYAVKAVCGQIPQTDPACFSYTAVNIHNPSKCDTVNFRWKAAAAGDLKAGVVTPFSILTLGPDQALGITNADILALFGKPPFIDGFVVLESPEELDVIAMYSLAAGATQPRQSASIERVPARCVPVCEDLVLNISTGVADWQTISSPETSSVVPVPVQPVALNPNWLPAPSGSIWVSAQGTDGGTGFGALPGDPSHSPPSNPYVYQLCFNLCSGFSNATLQMQGIADNSANVYLNGINPANLLGPTAVLNAAPINIPLKASLLRAGQNCLQIVVVNTFYQSNAPVGNSPTGFAIAGQLRVTGGRCPCTKLPLLPAPQGGPVGQATG
jgi:hypothetical protein